MLAESLGVARTGFDGRPDEGTQGRVDLEDGEEALAGDEVGAVEDLGQDIRIEAAEVFGDQLILPGEVLVEGALGDSGDLAELVDTGAVDALIGEQLLGSADALSPLVSAVHPHPLLRCGAPAGAACSRGR